MPRDVFEPEISARDALEGKYCQDGGRLPVDRVIHEAVADVEEGLEFWKTIAGNSGAQRHASREFLNRQG